MGQATTYRTCPRSGLQFESSAEKLMIANAVTAVVFLLIGGILAVGVVLTRWPAIHWLEADTFYQVLTAHGIDMLIFWIIFFEIAVLYFASSTLLRCRIATPKIAWLAFALMVIGSVLNNVAVFQGGSSVMMTSYVPMLAEPNFYLGIILFAVGALVACGVFFGTLVVAKREKTYEGSVPLVTFGAITAAVALPPVLVARRHAARDLDIDQLILGARLRRQRAHQMAAALQPAFAVVRVGHMLRRGL